VDAEAFCNCGDCLYKHHTIESDENFTEWKENGHAFANEWMIFIKIKMI
jgi:hypothetical protein